MIIGGIILTHKPDKDSGKQTNTAANTESPSNENTNAQNESESEKVSDIKAQPVDETNLKISLAMLKEFKLQGILRILLMHSTQQSMMLKLFSKQIFRKMKLKMPVKK